MTVASTIDALQAVALANSAIVTAPNHNAYPLTLNTADLPTSIIWPDNGTSYQKGSGYNIHDLVYRVVIYVMPAEQGLGISQGWDEALDLMQNLLDDFLDKDINNLVADGTYQSYVKASSGSPIIHNGLQILAYPVQATGIDGWPHYFGFELLIPTNEQWSQT